MISKVLWHSGLVSPAILGVALLASSGAFAQDGDFVIKPTDDRSETRVVAVKATQSLRVANVESKSQNSAVVEVTNTGSMAQVAANVSQTTQPTNPRASEKLTNSPEPVNNISQLPPTSPNEVDGSDSRVLEQIDDYSNDTDTNSLDQVTNVSLLRDVSPGDWAFEALRSLVERYGCIAGYPDGTYRGNRSLSRYEFAAGLNACLQQVERLLASGTSNLATKQDLATLRRLIEEFGPELATLRGKVDALEARTTELEMTQFSTTTKLSGAAIFALAGVAAGDTVNGNRVNKNTVLASRARLNFETSFTGKDLLRTRLQALNLDAFSGTSTFTPEGDLRFAGPTFATDNNNQVGLDALLYQFPIGKRTTVVIEGNVGQPDDYTNTVNPYLDGDGDSGALSNFGTRNPIYDLVSGAGIGLKHQFSDNLELSLGYIGTSPSVADSTAGRGLFNGPYGAIGQLTVKPSDKITLGLTYIHSYNNDLTAGSRRANLRSFLSGISAPSSSSSSAGTTQPSDSLADFGGSELPVSSNAYGLEASWKISPQLVLGGWVGYTATRTLAPLVGANGTVLERGDLSIWNWAVTLAVPDLGKEGSVAGIIVGMEPKVTSVSRSLRNTLGKDPDTSLHIEGFYQYKLTENIAITPGIIWLTAPDHNANNDDVVIGTIRTTFTF